MRAHVIGGLLALSGASPAFAQDDFGGEAAAPAAAPAPEEDPEAGWARPGYQRVKNARHERPVTMPHRTFDVFLGATVFTVSPTEESFYRLPIDYRDQGATVGLRYGAIYGITDDFELGALFPPMIFRRGIQFDGPVLSLAYRLIASDDFELAVWGGAIVPIANDLGFSGRIPLSWRVNPMVRVDVAPEVSVIQKDKHGYVNGALPASVALQFVPQWSARLTLGVTTLGFETAAMSAGTEVAYTFTGDNGAIADLTLGFAFPTLIDGSGRGVFVETSVWAVSVGARFFVRLPQMRGGE